MEQLRGVPGIQADDVVSEGATDFVNHVPADLKDEVLRMAPTLTRYESANTVSQFHVGPSSNIVWVIAHILVLLHLGITKT